MRGVLAGIALTLLAATPAAADIRYSTYAGGAGEDSVNGVAVDSQGRPVIVGATTSPDWTGLAPSRLPRPGQAPAMECDGNTCRDAFAARLSADGTRVEWFTWIGGSHDDAAAAVAVGPRDEVWVTGSTESRDMPLRAPVRAEHTGNYDDAFVARIEPDGEPSLVSYLGGDHYDHGNDITVDASGDAFVAGHTFSEETFPTTEGAHMRDCPEYCDDAGFVTRIGPSGIEASTLVSSAAGDERLSDVAVGAGVFLGGRSWNRSIFARMDRDLTRIDWQTALFTEGTDRLDGFALDRDGNPLYLIDEWAQASWSGINARIGRLDAATGAEGWSTLVSGDGSFDASGLTLAPDGGVLFGGRSGDRFRDEDDPYCLCIDAFAARLTPGGAIESTEGTNGSLPDDATHDLAAAADGSVWIAGRARSGDLATEDAVQRGHGHACPEATYGCYDGLLAHVTLVPYPRNGTRIDPGTGGGSLQPGAGTTPPAGGPAPTTTAGPASRRVGVRRRGRRVHVRVTSAAATCFARVPVRLERRRGRRWVAARRARTDARGRAALRASPRRRLRVVVPAVSGCARALSRPLSPRA